MFLQLSVILFTGGGVSLCRRCLCPGRGGGFVQEGSLSGGLCPGILCPGGLCPEGLCPKGVSVQGVAVQGGGLCPGGVSVRGSLSRMKAMTSSSVRA